MIDMGLSQNWGYLLKSQMVIEKWGTWWYPNAEQDLSARNWARHLQHAKTTSKMMSLNSCHWVKTTWTALEDFKSILAVSNISVDWWFYGILLSNWGLLQSCTCCASPSNFFLFPETSYLADLAFCDAFKAVEGHWTTGRCSDEA